ncbi:hypothetical protein KJZ71_02665 [Patescibacteria group bacterium]|uniref:Uncharacterized protein n=1 Tax=candidate division WWE3 bacterium TaxID=2053526 RepID=A0A928TQ29_UNCKA|nr:hypothetical protein [candidate division WWE3 bacterium]MCL4732687.1 hypothetical protein [Patescibacteria group bacterium]
MIQTIINPQSLPVRLYAGIFDRPIPSALVQFGVHPSPDAIGGYYGMGWIEVFRDHETGELFRVSCSDGTYGGKSSHTDADLAKIERLYQHILTRTHAEAGARVGVIRISSREWSIMLHHVHENWLDLKEGQKYADGDRAKDEGVIGHIMGIPVMVDPTFADDLPIL